MPSGPTCPGHAPLSAWLDLERLLYVAAVQDEVNAQLVALPSSRGRSRGVFCVVHFIRRAADRGLQGHGSIQRLTHERALMMGYRTLW